MATAGGYRSSRDQAAYQMSAQERMDRLEQDAVESSRRSVRVLDETLRVGVDTVVELDRQGEQLNRVDRRLDDIDADLVQSKRHLRQIRSVFGGIVNWFSNDKPVLTATPDSTRGTGQAIDDSRRLREEVDARRAERSSSRSAGPRSSASGRQMTAQTAYSREVDANVEQMSAGLSRLTDLALDMNEELARQNHQIAGMTGRVSKLDSEVENLTRVSRRI